jgi:hypothetical protein
MQVAVGQRAILVAAPIASPGSFPSLRQLGRRQTRHSAAGLRVVGRPQATLRCGRAPVAQWIEQRFPKPRALVRFRPGALTSPFRSGIAPVASSGAEVHFEYDEWPYYVSRRGAGPSGEHGVQIARAKERALQAYRDQERTARSQEADIGAREGRLHALVRAWKSLDFGLTAPERVRPILDTWAAPVTRHLSENDPPLQIDDPRKRTVETTLADISGDPKALT